MATKTSTRSGDRESSGRSLKHRSMPFVGPPLLPPSAIALALVVHYLNQDSPTANGLYAALVAFLASGFAGIALWLGRKRDPLVAWHVAGTVVLGALGVAITLVVGWNRWWIETALILGELIVGSWLLHRIDALRKDAKGETEQQEDGLTKKLGLENTKFGKATVHRDGQGDVTRIEVPVTHGPGETAAVIQQAVPGIESVADQTLGGGVPRGRSRAVPTDGAGTSKLVIITKDVLKGLIPYPGPSSPGGCITEPLVTGIYEDQEPVVNFIAGCRPEAPNASMSGWMGMTGTGKSANGQVRALEIFSRRNVAMFWFDSVKGAQTVKSLRRGLDIIFASDDPKAFRAGMKALGKLIAWRADRLGECGYENWTPEAATDPRLMMPFLVAHFEEADVLCEEAPDELVFVASKGRSTGVVLGISLQRADANSMPTSLRFNISGWNCFGTGDAVSVGFALSDFTIDAGAHPENWKQSKPGYFYAEGVGIPQDRWPIPAKSAYADARQREAHAEVWGPRMMPVDAGSIAALGDWYQKAKADTAALVAKWDEAPGAQPVVHDGVASKPAPASTNTDEDDFEATVAEIRDELDEVEEQLVADGTLDGMDAEARRIDPGVPTPPVRPGEELSWRSSKADAPSREAAIEALTRALSEIYAEPFPDPEDADDGETLRQEPDGSVLLTVGVICKRYRFRSRPWFSEALKDASAGRIQLDGLALEATDEPGEYRLRRVSEPAMVGHGG